MAIQTLDYSSASDWTVQEGAVTFIPGIGARILAAPKASSFIQSFDSDAGFIYDNTRVEFVNNRIRQLSAVPDNATFGAQYKFTIDGTWGDSPLAPVSTGGNPKITNNSLDLNTTPQSHVEYDMTNAFDPEKGTVKLKWKPATTNYEILWVCSRAIGSNDDYIALIYNGSRFTIQVKDENGNAMVGINLSTYTPSTTTFQEIELNYDTRGQGAYRLFVNGTLNGNLIVNGNPGTRSPKGSPMVFQIGGPSGAESFYKELVVFDTVQHTSNYVPGYNLPPKPYLKSTVQLPDFVYTGLGSIQSYVSLLPDGTSSVRYTINNKYWTGATWETSIDTYNTASPSNDINDNIASFPDVTNIITIKVMFSDGDSSQLVREIIFNYEGVAYPLVNRCDSNIGNNIDNLINFQIGPESDTPTGTELLFIINAGNADYWYNPVSTAWEVSDGTYLQANSAPIININASSFAFGTGKNTFFKTFLITNDEQVTPTIKTASYEFSFSVPSFALPPDIDLFGVILKGNKTAAVDSRLVIEYETAGVGNPYVAEDAIVRPFRMSLPANSQGVVESAIIPSEPYGRKYKFTLFYTLAGEDEERSEFWGYAAVPNQLLVNVNTLVFTETP